MYLDGALATTAVADSVRADVARAFPGVGDRHGYDVVVAVTISGDHHVCTVARNVGLGHDSFLGCQATGAIEVPDGSPVGSFPAFFYRSDPGSSWDPQTGVLRTAYGWVTDPDTTDPVTVVIKVNGVTVQQVVADIDPLTLGVNGTKTRYFRMSIVGPARPALVCADAVNVGYGHDRLLGCLGFP